jgi:hypothetical protein
MNWTLRMRKLWKMAVRVPKQQSRPVSEPTGLELAVQGSIEKTRTAVRQRVQRFGIKGLDYMDSEAQLELAAKADLVDLNRVGFMSVHKPKYVSINLFSKIVEIGVAQALLSVLAVSEGGLCVRSIFADHDLASGGSEELCRFREWMQPHPTRGWPSHYAPGTTMFSPENRWLFKYNQRTGDIEEDPNGLKYRNTYTTNMNTHYNRKVMIILGWANGNFPYERCYVQGIQANRGHVKIIDISDMSELERKGYLYYQSPILVKPADELRVEFLLKHDAIGHSDRLQPIGFVVEGNGHTMTG